RKTLEEFVSHPGPAFVEAMVDQNAHVYPMIGPGMGYKDMITGKFIVPRQANRPDPKKVDPSGMF
ncbi:MAG: biosynthetic-type acetolactate synthase large subunit, partial [Candidatus Binatia bacterium]